MKRIILKEVIIFLVITGVLTAGVFAWMFTSTKTNVFMHMVLMWVPGIAAIVTSLLQKDAIGAYGWRSGKFRFMGYAYILPIAAAFIAYGLVWISDFADIFTDGVKNYRWARMIGLETPVPVWVGILSKAFVAFLVTLPFALGEEIGWSGFLTQKLSRISSVTVTSVVVGICWAAWHFPMIVRGLYGYGTPLWIALPGFTLVLIGGSFIRTVLTVQSKSLWPGVILHTSHNTFLMGIFHDLTLQEGYADYIVSETGVFTGIVYIAVALLFWKSQIKNNAQ